MSKKDPITGIARYAHREEATRIMVCVLREFVEGFAKILEEKLGQKLTTSERNAIYDALSAQRIAKERELREANGYDVARASAKAAGLLPPGLPVVSAGTPLGVPGKEATP